jgi:O-antigen ligase
LPLLALLVAAAHPLVAFYVAPTPLVLRCLVGAELLATLARPSVGWLALIAVVPFGDLIGRAAGRPWQGAPWSATEPLVLAFLVGWLIRRAADPGPRAAAGESGTRLVRRLAALFGLAAASSLAVRLIVLQVTTAFPLDFLRSLVRFLWHDYYLVPRALPEVVGAAAILEGAGLLAVTTLIVAREGRLLTRGVAVIGGSAAIVALANLSWLVQQSLSGSPSLPLTTVLASRVAWVIPDVNAAGSYFVITLLSTGGMALSVPRARRVPWLVAAAGSLLGLVLAGSRTAFAAATLAVAVLIVRLGRRPGKVVTRVLVPAVAVLALVAGFYAVRSPRSNPLDLESGVRWRGEMMATSLRMAREFSVFGIGPGKFYEHSTEYMSPDWRAAHPRENAHNNFLQVLAELGGVGLVSLLALLGGLLRRAWQREPAAEIWPSALAAGLLGFVVTWLAGHPMLVREVALTFWICGGIVEPASSGSSPRDSGNARRAGRHSTSFAVAVVAAAVALLVPLVAERRLARSDLTEGGRGVSQWHRGADGVRFRWMLTRAVVYVPASAGTVTIGLRSPGGPATVRVMVAGRQASQVVVGSERWEEVRVRVPASRWISAPIGLQVRGSRPPRGGETEQRIQISLPVLMSSPPSFP